MIYSFKGIVHPKNSILPLITPSKICVLHITFELQQEPMRFVFILRITFELQQEPMRFVPTPQAGSVELYVR